ncbi:MAG: hypothetical protein ACKO26_20405, partial [Planctomycetota bacterium]
PKFRMPARPIPPRLRRSRGLRLLQALLVLLRLTVTRGGVVVSAPESVGTGANGQRRANPAGN